MILVVYDIPDDKRRTKLSNFLEGYGRRVQYSVFEIFVSLNEMRVLHQKVKKLVVSKEDNIRFYWIGQETLSLMLTIGSEKPESPPTFYIV